MSILLMAAIGLTACGGSGDGKTFRVEGAGMSPTLKNGAVVTVHPYGSGTPARGDIVVFQAPTSPDRDFVKRIIGLPSDTVEIDETAGVVKVNGDTLDEPYTAGRTLCNGDPDCTWEIPGEGSADSPPVCGSDACYFVLGDNRQNSSDSRQGWLVPLENIRGKVEP